MHFFCITRGIKHEVDKFITELQGKYFPMQVPDTDEKGNWTKTKPVAIQVGVQPIQLWSINFPAEHKDVMLNTLLGGSDGKTQHKKHNKFIWAIRKILGCEPISEYDKSQKLPISKDNMELVGIGIKPDYWQDKDGKRYYGTYTNPKPGEAFEGI